MDKWTSVLVGMQSLPARTSNYTKWEEAVVETLIKRLPLEFKAAYDKGLHWAFDFLPQQLRVVKSISDESSDLIYGRIQELNDLSKEVFLTDGQLCAVFEGLCASTSEKTRRLNMIHNRFGFLCYGSFHYLSIGHCFFPGTNEHRREEDFFFFSINPREAREHSMNEVFSSFLRNDYEMTTYYTQNIREVSFVEVINDYKEGKFWSFAKVSNG